MRHLYRLSILLVVGASASLFASSRTKEAKPVRDTSTTGFSATECHDEMYPAGNTPKFYEQMDWKAFRDELKLTTSNAASCAKGDLADPDQAYIIQVVHWQNKSADDAGDSNSKIGIVSSQWYVYRTVYRHPSLVTISGYTANGDPLVYGKKRALIVAINIFDDKKPNKITIDYKASVKQGTPENIQDLSTLVTSLLGLTLPTAKAATCKNVVVAYTCKDGTDRLPFDLNIVMTAAIKQPKKDGSPAGGEVPVPQAVPQSAPESMLSNPSSGSSQGHDAILSTQSSQPHTSKNAVSLVQADLRTSEGLALDHHVDNPSPPQQNGDGSPQASSASDNGSTDKSSQSTLQPGTVDCYDLASQQKCTSSRVFTSQDREWWDVSVGVTIPGVRQSTYSFSNGMVQSKVTTNTNMYGLFDVYPAAYWYTKGSAIPHLAVGLPLTGQTFYRPFFGMAENLTSWTGLERHGFPIRLNFFVGVVYMKTQTITDHPTTNDQFTHDLTMTRVVKALYGVEVPISSIKDKIDKGSSAKNNNASNTGKGQ